MKRNGKKTEPLIIEYNEEAQKDFVTGFRKRKLERTRKSVLKYKLKHIEEKRESRLPKLVNNYFCFYHYDCQHSFIHSYVFKFKFIFILL